MCILLLTVVCQEAPSPGETAPGTDPRSALGTRPVAPTRAEAAAEATGLVGRMGVTSDSSQMRDRLLELFERVFVVPISATEPFPDTVPTDVLLAVHERALDGDHTYLIALMRAARGWYGATCEGGVWLNEMLFEALEAQPQLTADALADLPVGMRKRLVDEIYAMPIHDGFDFPSLLDGLYSVDVPAGLEADVERIITVLARENGQRPATLAEHHGGCMSPLSYSNGR